MMSLKKGFILFSIQILLALGTFIAMAIVMDTSDRLIYDTSTVLALLQGYESWYNTILIVCLIGAIIATVGNLVIIGLVVKGLISEIKGSNRRTFNSVHQAVRYFLGTIAFAMFPVGILAMTVLADGTLENANFATADINAIETGDLIVVEIESFSSGGCSRRRLPEPTGGNAENNLCGHMSFDTNGERVSILVLESDHERFMDLINYERAALSSYSSETGNRDASNRIEIIMTPNFNLVIDFNPVRVGWE